MNQDISSKLKTKLKKRVLRLLDYNVQFTFHDVHKELWFFVKKTPILNSICKTIEIKHSDIQLEINNFFKIDSSENLNLFKESHHNEELYAVHAYFITQQAIQDNQDPYIEITIGQNINSETNDRKLALNKFKQEIIEPLFEYIKEQLDDQKITIDLIRRYKQKSEWFNRQKLYKIWDENSKKGEKLLALNLYEYLFDCGLEFDIEPWSINGEPDLVVAQKSDPLIADAKIFKGDKSYIIKGFNQVYTYTLTYNQPFGYLIIYKTCEKDLRFSLNNQTQSTQFITCNNKTIFITVIDIFNYEATASQRKPVKPIEITEQDLIDGLDRDNKLDET